MKAMITGGAGFIGGHLAKRLAKAGYSVTLVDNFSRGVDDRFLHQLTQEYKVSLITADLMENDSLDLLGRDYDYIFHLAAIIGVLNVVSRAYDVLHMNAELLFHVLNFAKKQTNLKRFVFASTSEVYAGTLQFFGMRIPTPEDTPLTITPLEQPRTSYMLSKIYGECLLHHCGLPYTIIRPHNFYGPRMGMSHVIPELLKKAYFTESGGKLPVFSADHKRSFCFISDAVEIILRLAEHADTIGNAYNIGNEQPEVTMYEVAERILQITGKSLEIEALPATEGSPKRRCPNMEKTFACTGYRCKVSLEEGIQKTFEWYRENVFNGSEVSAR